VLAFASQPLMTEAKIAGICTILTAVQLPDGAASADLIDALVKLMMAGARFDGFWSGEMLPPDEEIHQIENQIKHQIEHQSQWKLIQRFVRQAEAEAWHQSDIHNQLFRVCTALAKSSSSRLITTGEDADQNSMVVTAIVTDVRPGMEEQYFAWEEKIQRAQAQYQPPAPGRPPQWATLLKFDSPANLQLWFASKERNTLLVEGERFVKNFRVSQVTSAFPGWIAVDEKTGESPRSWKTAVLVLLGLYPVVVILIKNVNPLFESWPPALVTFFSLVASVCATTFVTMPLFNKLFKWYMYPDPSQRLLINLGGTAGFFFLFACEIAIFWK